ncbi:MAG: SMP-30/gluconolactonase/LRE family protein, partial [Gemmataceae bacterium]|nr:SMP-30/gluconolactonase/LRE family protein [Gemmataceae bacterium]
MRFVTTFVAGLCGVAFTLPAPAADPPPLKYTTTWIGNTFGGGKEWVQNFAEDLCMLPDGTCVVGSFWDEAGREVGLYKDGKPVGMLEHTHMRGGKAVAATAKWVFYAHTCAREDQPEVKAGEAAKEKAICLFGVSRWTPDGKVAPFDGGKTSHKNMVVLSEAPDDHALIPRGLTTDGKLLYLADTTADRVRVFDTETMAAVRDFQADKPERMALDAAGNLWVTPTGGAKVLSLTAFGKARAVTVPLPETTVAAALAFDPDGRLVVADHGPRQQLLVFDVRTPAAKLEDTFGEEGGMFAKPNPGRAGPTRLAMPTGVGYDAKGNLYVTCNVPSGGTVIR